MPDWINGRASEDTESSSSLHLLAQYLTNCRTWEESSLDVKRGFMLTTEVEGFVVINGN